MRVLPREVSLVARALIAGVGDVVLRFPVRERLQAALALGLSLQVRVRVSPVTQRARTIAHGGQPRINNLRQGPILVRDLATHVACLLKKCRNAGSRNLRHAPFQAAPPSVPRSVENLRIPLSRSSGAENLRSRPIAEKRRRRSGIDLARSVQDLERPTN